MSRALIILYIVFWFDMGVFLFLLPWTPLWSRNFFVAQYPWVSSIALNYFVRGAVSGIGLADIGLAVYELWRFRRQVGLVQTRTTR